MSDLNRLRELAGLERVKTLEAIDSKSDTTEPVPAVDEPASEDADGDGTVSPDESSNVQTASADIAKAKIHIKNIQKLAETIKSDIGKYTVKIEKYINDEFGSISGLSEIDQESATKIMGYFTKLHAIANGK
jgi:cytochrome oxidase assembly protein ShyY1